MFLDRRSCGSGYLLYPLRPKSVNPKTGSVMDWGNEWLVRWTLPAVNILGILIFLDFVMGVSVAFSRGEVASLLCMKGWIKKIAMFVGVSVGLCVDLLCLNYQSNMPFQIPDGMMLPVGGLFAIGFCGVEIISVFEKIKRSGVRLPSFMVAFLERFRQPTEGPKSQGSLIPSLNLNVDHVEIKKVESDIKDASKVARVAAKHATRRAEQAVQRAEIKAEEAGHVLEEIRDKQIEDSEILRQTHETIQQMGDTKRE